VSAPSAPDSTWGACRFCGVAVEPGARACGICGAANPLSAAELRTVQGPTRTRIRLTGLMRTLIVVGVSVGLAVSLITLVLQGPPVVGDPLTTTGTYTIGPGNFTIISGEITGGDFVIGNFTATDPVGTDLEVTVYNSTEAAAFLAGQPSTSVWTLAPTSDGRIIYSAPYTDTFSFVFSNPYPVSSHLTIEAYIATNYESNVGDDGFG
jgi:hypothetical protein